MFEVLNDRSVLEVSGPDSFKFLQNLITNDIAKNNYCYSYILSNQGKYLFDFFVFKDSNERFLIDINKNELSLFKNKLLLYKLRANVTFMDLDDYSIIYSPAALDFPSLISTRDPRCNLLGFRSIVAQDITRSTAQDLYIKDKYNLAITDGYIDLIYDRSIPLEYGAEELVGISYTKGCYVGQEVMSRTKYQGVIRKKIFHLSSDSDLSNLSKNDEINIDNVAIGIICSAHQNNAIGLIREEKYLALHNKEVNMDKAIIKLSIPQWRAMPPVGQIR
jgi:folate-binding protein YgfZ